MAAYCRGLIKLAAFGAAIALLGACAPIAQRTADGTLWVPSPNFDERRPNFVVIHETTGASVEPSLATLTDPARKVSAHYLIGRDGSLYQLVDENKRAWHAGVSYWGGQTDINSASIGIELDNTGEEPFPVVQIDTLLALLERVTQRHAIPRGNVIGHGDVAPGRKVDPSRLFPWRQLAERGFGLWCTPDDTLPAPNFDPALGLRALGYDTSRLPATIAAFRRHFLGDDGSELGEDGARMLDCLLRRATLTAAPTAN